MQLTYEAKLYPNKHQEQKLLDIFYNARKLYNEILETKVNAYKNEKKTIDFKYKVTATSNAVVPRQNQQI